MNKDPVKYGLPSDFKVSLRTVRRYMDKVAPKPTYAPEKVRHFECAPGQQLQIDFTHGHISLSSLYTLTLLKHHG